MSPFEIRDTGDRGEGLFARRPIAKGTTWTIEGTWSRSRAPTGFNFQARSNSDALYLSNAGSEPVTYPELPAQTRRHIRGKRREFFNVAADVPSMKINDCVYRPGMSRRKYNQGRRHGTFDNVLVCFDESLSLCCIALRDIEKDEELGFPYGDQFWWPE